MAEFKKEVKDVAGKVDDKNEGTALELLEEDDEFEVQR